MINITTKKSFIQIIKIPLNNWDAAQHNIANNALMRCVFFSYLLYWLNLSIIVYKSLHNKIRKFVITFAVTGGDLNGMRWEITDGIFFYVGDQKPNT